MISGQQASADELVEKFQLKPHPQGCGFFLETDRNPNIVTILNNHGEHKERNTSTSIIAIFKGGQVNPLHRTSSTQIIHYYPGGNSNLLVHTIENGKLKTYNMPIDTFQLKIPGKTWFAFEVEDQNKLSFVITGHTVSPGFDIEDFELADKQSLLYQFPSLSNFIEKFTLSNSSCSSGSTQENRDSQKISLLKCRL